VLDANAFTDGNNEKTTIADDPKDDFYASEKGKLNIDHNCHEDSDHGKGTENRRDNCEGMDLLGYAKLLCTPWILGIILTVHNRTAQLANN
jgi:hypothetical protein